METKDAVLEAMMYRACMLATFEKAIKNGGQRSLFDLPGERAMKEVSPLVLEDVIPMLIEERKVCGMYVTCHPMILLKNYLEMASHRCADVREGDDVVVCGIIESLNLVRAKSGTMFFKFFVTDDTKPLECVSWDRNPEIVEGKPLFLDGKVRLYKERISLSVDAVYRLEVGKNRPWDISVVPDEY